MTKCRSLAEQIGGKCRHFNGLMNKACDAGIVYESVEGVRVPYRKNLPCFKDAEAPGCCDKRSFYSDEEVAEQVEESQASFKRTIGARNAIVKHLNETKANLAVDQSGLIGCPVCHDVTLSFSRAACNGHIWAKCSKGCVSWME